MHLFVHWLTRDTSRELWFLSFIHHIATVWMPNNFFQLFSYSWSVAWLCQVHCVDLMINFLYQGRCRMVPSVSACIMYRSAIRVNYSATTWPLLLPILPRQHSFISGRWDLPLQQSSQQGWWHCNLLTVPSTFVDTHALLHIQNCIVLLYSTLILLPQDQIDRQPNQQPTGLWKKWKENSPRPTRSYVNILRLTTHHHSGW